MGVEEELLLVDWRTGAPSAKAESLLRDDQSDQPDQDAPAPESGMIEGELQQQQIETDTAPCSTLDELADEIRRWRRSADDLARSVGARVAALGTSPLPVSPEVMPKARYQRMVEHFGLTTVEQLSCGCHVHVDVESEEEAVAVLDRIRVWLPAILALSANSPYWQGIDSRYASFRAQAWSRFPSAGPTDVFGSAAAYTTRVEALVASGVLLDRGMIYFDARASDKYPTVEIRVADVCLEVDDAVAVAGLIRALVDTAADEHRAGIAPAAVPTDLVRMAAWRASRSGVGSDLLDPLTCRPRPALDVIAALLEHVGPALRANGDQDRVDHAVEEILRRGSGATFQRALANRADGDLSGITLAAAERTLGD